MNVAAARAIHGQLPARVAGRDRDAFTVGDGPRLQRTQASALPAFNGLVLVTVGADKQEAHVEAGLAAQFHAVVLRLELVPVPPDLAAVEHDAEVPGPGGGRSRDCKRERNQ